MKKLILLALLSFFVTTPVRAAEHESTFDRVMRTGTIRCAYGNYDPSNIKDPNTGKMSGIFYDLTEEVGRRLGLKIEWVEEAGYGVIAEGFRTGRYDAFCGTVWPTADRVKSGTFSIPLYYSQVGVFVRANDHRFDNNYMLLNDPHYTLAVKDGDISFSIAKARFPLAKQDSVMQMSLTEQQLMEVATGKADATFNEPALIYRYNEHNPDKKLRNIAAAKPLKYFPNTYMLPPNEYQLKQMFDVTLGELLSEGIVDDILKKYERPGIVNLRVALPFVPAGQ